MGEPTSWCRVACGRGEPESRCRCERHLPLQRVPLRLERRRPLLHEPKQLRVVLVEELAALAKLHALLRRRGLLSAHHLHAHRERIVRRLQCAALRAQLARTLGLLGELQLNLAEPLQLGGLRLQLRAQAVDRARALV